MKRMKKKVVAMVTLAMFLMTLLPMAAFAGYGSTVEVDKDSQEVTLNAQNQAKIDVNATLVVEDVDRIDATQWNNMYVWLTKGDKPYTTYATYGDGFSAVNREGTLKNVGRIEITKNGTNSVKASGSITVKNAGEYTVHIGYIAGDSMSKVNLSDVTEIATSPVAAVVKNPEITAKTITVAGATSTGDNSGYIHEEDFIANGVNAQAITVTVDSEDEDENQWPDSVGKVVKIQNDNSNLTIKDEDNKKEVSEVTVEEGKTATFNVVPDTTTKDGSYIITLTCDDVSYDLSLKYGEEATEVKSLALAEAPDTVFGTKETGDVSLESVARFVAKNEDGDILDVDSKLPQVQFSIKEQPKDKLETTDLSVVAIDDTDALTLQAPASKLVAGDYVIRVALANEKSYVDLSFKVVKAGDPVDIVFDKITSTSGTVTTDVENDEVVFGETINGSVKYVDANGVKFDTTNASIDIDGPAVDKNNSLVGPSNGEFKFVTKAVDGDRDAAIGSKVTVTVWDNKVNKNIVKEFTVVDGETAYKLAFDAEEGDVQKENAVKASIVDENGKLVKGLANENQMKVNYYVASNSNEDANVKVTVSQQSFQDVKEGKANLKVYSDKATVAEIVVYVTNKANKAVYGGTLKYTFGEQDIPADTSVVMTLGSTEMLVNNKIVDMKDAAPMATQNRTFVPFRPLGEALGAQVDYDKDAKTVTYKLGSTEIVMTLDSKDYTVNGAKKTMDVAPFAKDNRTYVPVRFVGEALGFKVTGLQDGNGKYVAVAFTK